MESIQRYTREGEYKGVGFYVDIWQFETGEVSVEGITIEGSRTRRLSDGSHEEFTSIQQGFEYGAKLAREMIDRL